MLFARIFLLLILLNGLAVHAATIFSAWDHVNSGLENLDISEAWYSKDLRQAAFFREGRTHKSVDGKIIQMTQKMSQLDDTYYFYGMKEDEAKDFVEFHQKQTMTKSAPAPACKPAAEDISLLEKIKNFINGEPLRKMIGCSAKSPGLEAKISSKYSVKEFAGFLSNHWDQLRSIFAFLPNVALPPDILSSVLCEAFVVVGQGAVLSATGVGAVFVVPRLMRAIAEIIRSARYAGVFAKVGPKTVGDFNILRNQQKIARNLQVGAKESKLKGGANASKSADDGDDFLSVFRDEPKFTEHSLHVETELGMQNDILVTLERLERSGRVGAHPGLNISKERAEAVKRIQELKREIKELSI